MPEARLRFPLGALLWMVRVFQVEGGEYQDDSDIRYQPFPELVSKEENIDGNDCSSQERDVNCRANASSAPSRERT